MALLGQERARRRLGGGAQLHLGCERLERDPDAIVLSARRRFDLARIDENGAALDQTLLGEMVPVPLSDRDQCEWPGWGDGISDDGVLRQPAQSRRIIRGDDARARPPMVPDGRGQQRAALRVDGRGVQHLHQHLFGPGLLP